MKTNCKYLLIYTLICLCLAGCSEDDPMAAGGKVALQSVTVSAAAAQSAGAVDAADPTGSDIAARAASGHRMTVKIGENSGFYRYGGGRWVPENDPVVFPGYDASEVTVELAKNGAVQDGTATGLMDADALRAHIGRQSPASELASVDMEHAKTLVSVEFDRSIGVGEVTDVALGRGTKAYNVPASTVFQAIIEPGSDGFELSFDYKDKQLTAYISKSNVDGGEFLPGSKYVVDLIVNTQHELMLKTVYLAAWGEGGTGSGGRFAETFFEIEGAATRVQLKYLSGITMEFDVDPVTFEGSVAGIEGDVVESIKVNGGPEILIGRATGSTVLLKVDSTGRLRERLDADGETVLINAYGELTNTANSNYMGKYLQQTELDLMNRDWSTLGYNSGPWSKFPFSGVYDGNGRKIYNLSLADDNKALFGYNTGTIRNVHIVSITFTGNPGRYVGSVCAYNEGVIENCINEADITASANAGGICADLAAGGSIINCLNRGDVVCVGGALGGIVGWNDSGTIARCTNEGNVASTNRGYYIGGITGRMVTAGMIADCRNSGTVTGYNTTAGIVGQIAAGTLSACHNTGEVKAENGWSGGIAGEHMGTLMIGCRNDGDVSGLGFIGGIAGVAGNPMTACCNTGRVCNIQGDPVGPGFGGIAGGVNFDASNNLLPVVSACYNTGDVEYNGAEASVGGAFGQVLDGAQVKACFWAGYSGSGVGDDQGAATDVVRFGESAAPNGGWPQANASLGWGLSAEGAPQNGYCWKSLGSASVPTYPTLWWETVIRSIPAKVGDAPQYREKTAKGWDSVQSPTGI